MLWCPELSLLLEVFTQHFKVNLFHLYSWHSLTLICHSTHNFPCSTMVLCLCILIVSTRRAGSPLHFFLTHFSIFFFFHDCARKVHLLCKALPSSQEQLDAYSPKLWWQLTHIPIITLPYHLFIVHMSFWTNISLVYIAPVLSSSEMINKYLLKYFS